jgi:hypothetical protein
MIIIFLFLLWLIIGASGFIFWWTKDDDFILECIPICLFASITGIFAWLLGYIIHGNKVIIKKRGSK